MAISRLLEVGKRSLQSSQSAINTTATNIANVNTEGYTRRRANISNVNITGQIGIGVTVDDISRIHQGFLDKQLWGENHGLGKYETLNRTLTQVEATFADSTDGGVRAALEQFWSSWSELADDPESASAREIVRDSGSRLATALNSTHGDLLLQQEQAVRELDLQVAEVNRLTTEIAEVNTELTRVNSPELLDERDRLINELSKKVNITVREGSNSAANISINGVELVSGGESLNLETTVSQREGVYTAVIHIPGFEKEMDGLSGEIGALQEMVNRFVPQYLEDLNALTRAVAGGVNELHAAGANLDDITGLNFFDFAEGGAGAIKVAPEILADAGLIATRTPGSGDGNNDVVNAISALQSSDLLEGNTAAGFFADVMSGLGSQLQQARIAETSQELITGELLSQKDSISGVSLDEEMTRLVQYEQSYEAAARLVRTVDEMMDTLLSIV